MRFTVLITVLLASACGRWGFNAAYIEGDPNSDVAFSPGDVNESPWQSTMASLTVSVTDGGRVLSQPPGIDCTGECTATFPRGTEVTLSAVADAGQVLVDWERMTCSPGSSCAVQLDSNRQTWAAFAPAGNLVFLTSRSYPGDLGGIAGADAICAQHAAEAGLPGTFVAFMSTSAVDAIDRLSGSKGWRRTDGRPVLNEITELIDGVVQYPPYLDEYGNRVPRESYWSGTNWLGRLDQASPNCEDFTSSTLSDPMSAVGDASAGAKRLLRGGVATCATDKALLCFELGSVVDVEPLVPREGRLAFVSSTWMPNTGIDAADARCQADAADAGLPGTYSAVLGTTTDAPASRFDVSAEPWVRLDGIPVTSTAGDFFHAVNVDTPVLFDASGASMGVGVITGAARPDEPAAPGGNCDDYTTTQGTANAGAADSTRSSVWFGLFNLDCASSARVYCLED